MTDYICRRCWATVECICSGYEPPWHLNLSANLAAAGMAATIERLEDAQRQTTVALAALEIAEVMP